MENFDELRDLAADVRTFIESSEDPAAALRDVVAAYDVVLGIFPSEEGMGLHVVKGSIRLILTNEEFELHTGDTVTFPGREPHTWINPTDEAVEVLWVLVPAASR